MFGSCLSRHNSTLAVTQQYDFTEWVLAACEFINNRFQVRDQDLQGGPSEIPGGFAHTPIVVTESGKAVTRQRVRKQGERFEITYRPHSRVAVLGTAARYHYDQRTVQSVAGQGEGTADGYGVVLYNQFFLPVRFLIGRMMASFNRLVLPVQLKRKDLTALPELSANEGIGPEAAAKAGHARACEESKADGIFIKNGNILKGDAGGSLLGNIDGAFKAGSVFFEMGDDLQPLPHDRNMSFPISRQRILTE